MCKSCRTREELFYRDKKGSWYAYKKQIVHGFLLVESLLGKKTGLSPSCGPLPLSQCVKDSFMASLSCSFSVIQLCPTLCDPIDGSLSGSPVPGILQARTLEWVGHFLLQCMKMKSESEVAQSCPTLSNPIDCSLPGLSVHGIFQARVLEWGAIAFSRYTQYLAIKE